MDSGRIAVPLALAVDLISFTPELPDDVRKATSETPVWVDDMVKAIAVYDSPFWRKQQLAGALFGFAHSGTFFHQSEEEIAEEFRMQLIRICGEVAAHSQHLAVMNLVKEKYTMPLHTVSAGGFGHELF